MELETTGATLLTRSPSRTIRVFSYPQILSSPVEAESTLEEDFINRAVLFSALRVLVSQPFILPVSPNGYTPDFFVKTAAGRRFVIEVKIDRRVQGYAELFDKAAAYLREKDITFLVVTEKNLRRERVQKRALRILRYLKAQYPKTSCDEVISEITKHPNGVTIGQIIKKGVTRELIFHLIASQKLTTGPRLMLDDSALVFVPNQKEIDHENSFARWLGVTPWGKDL
jgi:hypothetical protein